MTTTTEGTTETTRRATVGRRDAGCPTWCETASEYPCRGEHYDQKSYLTAGGHPHEVAHEGAQYPVVGIGLDHSEHNGHDAPRVMFWVSAGDRDWEVMLRPG